MARRVVAKRSPTHHRRSLRTGVSTWPGARRRKLQLKPQLQPQPQPQLQLQTQRQLQTTRRRGAEDAETQRTSGRVEAPCATSQFLVESRSGGFGESARPLGREWLPERQSPKNPARWARGSIERLSSASPRPLRPLRQSSSLRSRTGDPTSSARSRHRGSDRSGPARTLAGLQSNLYFPGIV